MITISKIGKYGIYDYFNVLRDGARVGVILRRGAREGWVVQDVGYNTMHRFRSIDAAKAWATANEDWPTPMDVHFAACVDVYERRYSAAVDDHADTIARLAREMLRGSNSARVELDELYAAIDRRAMDDETISHEVVLANGQLARYRYTPYYPDLPGRRQEAA